MTPLTTRARELAARERKLYDQRTIPAVMEELADEVERLMADRDRWEQHAADLINASGQKCACGYDDPEDICVGHYPKFHALQTEADKLRAEAANSAAQRDEAEKLADVAEERLRAVEADLVAALKDKREMALQALASMGQAQEAYEAQLAAEAELARIRAADRTSVTVRTTEAAKMRKGQAI